MGFSQLQFPIGILSFGLVASILVSFIEKILENCLTLCKSSKNRHFSPFKVQTKSKVEIKNELLLKFKEYLNKMDVDDQIVKLNAFLGIKNQDKFISNAIDDKNSDPNQSDVDQFILEVVHEAANTKENNCKLI